MEPTVSEDGANCVVREAIDEGVGCNWTVSSKLWEGEFLSANGLQNVAVLFKIFWVKAKNFVVTEGWLFGNMVIYM